MQKKNNVWGKLLIIGIFLFILIVFISVILFFSKQFEGFGSGQIGLIELKGEIASEQGFLESGVSYKQVLEELNEAEENPSIKAVLLEIDSPGGEIVATKQIVEKIRSMKKPVVSWIGEIGTSGAYYAASASDLIIADEDSITGSIGVISVSPNIEELLKKIGVKVMILKEGKYKAIGNPFEEMTQEEESLLQEMLHDAFLHFKRDVLIFRKGKLKEELFDEIADGRIMSGKKAKENGLIDLLGSREFAIKKTAEKAGIKGKPSLMELKKTRIGLFDLFSESGKAFGNGIGNGFRKSITENQIKIS